MGRLCDAYRISIGFHMCFLYDSKCGSYKFYAGMFVGVLVWMLAGLFVGMSVRMLVGMSCGDALWVSCRIPSVIILCFFFDSNRHACRIMVGCF